MRKILTVHSSAWQKFTLLLIQRFNKEMKHKSICSPRAIGTGPRILLLLADHCYLYSVADFYAQERHAQVHFHEISLGRGSRYYSFVVEKYRHQNSRYPLPLINKMDYAKNDCKFKLNLPWRFLLLPTVWNKKQTSIRHMEFFVTFTCPGLLKRSIDQHERWQTGPIYCVHYAHRRLQLQLQTNTYKHIHNDTTAP